MGIENEGFISINDVADVVKKALGEGFVYRTSKPSSDSVTIRAAIRQDEEFRALFSPVLWDEFIPSGADTPGSKLSTLFNRKLGYVNRHGLVGAKKAYFKLVTPQLFSHEIKHVEGDLIHLSARKLAHGADFFSESKISSDENRTLDYTSAKSKIISSLARELTILIDAKEPFGKICLALAALRERGYITSSGVTEEGVPVILSALLLLSLNLFGENESEYREIVSGIADIISSGSAKKESGSDATLSKAEVAETIFNLSVIAGERLAGCKKITKEELLEILRGII